MGQRPLRFPGKTDCHPGKGFVNWWENQGERENKKAERQAAKREIEEEIDGPNAREQSRD